MIETANQKTVQQKVKYSLWNVKKIDKKYAWQTIATFKEIHISTYSVENYVSKNYIGFYVLGLTTYFTVFFLFRSKEVEVDLWHLNNVKIIKLGTPPIDRREPLNLLFYFDCKKSIFPKQTECISQPTYFSQKNQKRPGHL